jgi:hypothetical protein
MEGALVSNYLGGSTMKRVLAALAVASVMAIGCASPTAPVSTGKLAVTPLLECGTNSNNSNNPPATSGSCGTNGTNNNSNNPPTTAKP